MTFPLDILIVSSDLESRRALSNILDRQELDPICVPTIHEALDLLSHRGIGLVFCDHYLPDGNYRDFLAALRSLKIKARVVLTSRRADWDEYLDAMRLGAFDVIATPCRPTDVEWMVIQANRDERNRSRPEPYSAEVDSNTGQAAAGAR